MCNSARQPARSVPGHMEPLSSKFFILVFLNFKKYTMDLKFGKTILPHGGRDQPPWATADSSLCTGTVARAAVVPHDGRFRPFLKVITFFV
jgi:hypothetical protein